MTYGYLDFILNMGNSLKLHMIDKNNKSLSLEYFELQQLEFIAVS